MHSVLCGQGRRPIRNGAWPPLREMIHMITQVTSKRGVDEPLAEDRWSAVYSGSSPHAQVRPWAYPLGASACTGDEREAGGPTEHVRSTGGYAL